MSFHYAREPGAEGQILTGDGASVGLFLSDLISSGPLPVRAALELVSYLADILTIADEDQAHHGDIKPGRIRIDESGAVSLEGWGAERRSGRAPEGAGAAPADVYGVGVVLHACLSDIGLGALPRSREDHDAVIAERIAEIDWQDLNDKRWMDEVLHFICGMLAFDPGARPVPLDVANILGQVSAQAEGEDLAVWAGRVVEPLSRDEPKRPAPLAAEEEDLGGPEVLDAPVSQGQAFSMRKAASAKGESTAFWTRDRIREMLADEDEEDEPVRQRFTPREPQVPPTESTTPRAPRLPNPVSGAPLVPPFPDATIEGQPARISRGSRPPPNLSGSVHDVPEPPENMRPPAAPAPAVPPPPVRQPSGLGRPGASGAPVASNSTVGPPSLGQAAPAVGDGRRLKIALFVGGLMVFLCAGGAAGTAAVMYTLKQQAEAEAEAALVRPASVPAQRPAQKKAADSGDSDDKAESGPSPAAEKKAPAKKTTRKTTRATSGQATKKATKKRTKTATKKAKKRAAEPAPAVTSKSGAPAGASAPAPTPPSGLAAAPVATPGGFPATVKWVHQGIETTLECSPGGRKVFVGTLRMQIEDVTTCRVKTAASRTAVQLRRGGTVTCMETDGGLACSGPR